jgi:hypothetical protein
VTVDSNSTTESRQTMKTKRETVNETPFLSLASASSRQENTIMAMCLQRCNAMAWTSGGRLSTRYPLTRQGIIDAARDIRRDCARKTCAECGERMKFLFADEKPKPEIGWNEAGYVHADTRDIMCKPKRGRVK